MTLGTFGEECKCVVCAEAVHMEGLKLKAFICIDLTNGINLILDYINLGWEC
jgi:hypothetical protein